MLRKIRKIGKSLVRLEDEHIVLQVRMGTLNPLIYHLVWISFCFG